MRVGSARMTWSPDVRNSRNPYAETIVNSAEPTQTSMCVRKPASRSRSSRSNPIAPPSAAAIPSRRKLSPQPREGTVALSTCGRQRRLLFAAEPPAPDGGEVEQLVENVARERTAFRGRLYLDELGLARHHDVHVH